MYLQSNFFCLLPIFVNKYIITLKKKTFVIGTRGMKSIKLLLRQDIDDECLNKFNIFARASILLSPNRHIFIKYKLKDY